MIIDSETSRIRAALVNTGRHSFAEAEAKLLATKLSIRIGDDAARTPAGQAALLTSVSTGARCFGEVTVIGTLEHPLRVPLPIPARTLAEAVRFLGAAPNPADDTTRTIVIGESVNSEASWSVRAHWDGWIAGVLPSACSMPLGPSKCALAGVAAGGLAVGEAFLAEQGDPRAGKRAQLLSLWSPELGEAASDAGPEYFALPLQLWLVGLGNLGQAYLWSMFMLPYPEPGCVELFVQDQDHVKRGNWGTSILVERGRYGVLKTRIAEEWAVRRGFRIRRIDRRLDEHLRRHNDEPVIALAGLDRMPPRRLLGLPGFHHIIDVGLGAAVADYRKFRLNAFDGAYSPSQHFAGIDDDTAGRISDLQKLPAFQTLINADQVNACGVAQLAEIPVAVQFVSALAGALAVSQLIRIASAEPPCRSLIGTVGELRNVRGKLGDPPGRITFATTDSTYWPPRLL